MSKFLLTFDGSSRNGKKYHFYFKQALGFRGIDKKKYSIIVSLYANILKVSCYL